MKRTLLLIIVLPLLAFSAYVLYFLFGETPLITGQTWHVHDINRPLPEVQDPGNSLGIVKAPTGAIILFDGTNLDHFQNKNLEVSGGAMIMGEGEQQTIQSFGDIQLHLEWASPSLAEYSEPHNGQDRGNSGIYLMGLYELQVLDSYQNPTYADGQAGALYGVLPPLVNVSRPTGEWQSYDITFTSPKFYENGKLKSPASVTLFHNGVLVQQDSIFNGATEWRRNGSYETHAAELPLGLQFHGSPVRYRNIWLQKL